MGVWSKLNDQQQQVFESQNVFHTGHFLSQKVWQSPLSGIATSWGKNVWLRKPAQNATIYGRIGGTLSVTLGLFLVQGDWQNTVRVFFACFCCYTRHRKVVAGAKGGCGCKYLPNCTNTSIFLDCDVPKVLETRCL